MSGNGKYDVGYGKPPKRTQFKKGQSGNPKGRPRVLPSIRVKLREILNERVKATVNGEEVRMSSWEAFIRSVRQRAIKGDARATSMLYGMIKEHGLFPPEEQVSTVEVKLVRAPPREPAPYLRPSSALTKPEAS